LQTWFMPHDVPSVAFAPVSVHESVPPAQEAVPLWHALLGVQGAPAVHAWHAPPMQYMFIPHEVPFG
jgi:hypothetical protein